MKSPSRLRIAVLAILALPLFVMLAGDRCRHRIIWNTSPSVAVGFYVLDASASPQRGDLVYFDEPTDALAIARNRGYMPPGGHFLKTVGALPGDSFCTGFPTTDSGFLSVRGRLHGFVYRADRAGRPLVSNTGCRTVPDDHFLPLGVHPTSYDGRYYGAVPLEAVYGVARPLLTFE